MQQAIQEKLKNLYSEIEELLSGGEKDNFHEILPKNRQEKHQQIFYSLSAQFEGGVLLKKQSEHWVSLNHMGPIPSDILNQSLSLPIIRKQQSVRARASGLLKKWVPQKKWTQYKNHHWVLFQPSQDYSFLFLCDSPEILLYHKCESVLKFLSQKKLSHG